jgi:uncharacterized membrane protein HdeD (DUF308 family)
MLMLLARNWWALALRGLCAIVFGIAAFAWPGPTVEILVYLYGAYALVDGAFMLIAALLGRTAGVRWELVLIGLVGIAVGIMTFAWPTVTALALLYLIAAWAILCGVFQVIAAIQLRKEIEGEWLLALSGAAAVLFGGFLIARPSEGAIALIQVIAIFAILFGALLVGLALRLRGLHNRLAAAGVPSST